MNVKIKVLEHGEGIPLPSYATAGSAGMDLCSAVRTVIGPGGRVLIPCGFTMELPDGYEAQIRSRSGLARKYGVSVAMGVGTVDSDYRGEIGVLLQNLSGGAFSISIGDRIAQMVIAPFTRIGWEQVDALGDTERGQGGFGSTGVSTHG